MLFTVISTEGFVYLTTRDAGLASRMARRLEAFVHALSLN